MLNSADLSGLPIQFNNYFGKAINVILTGHIYTPTLTPASVPASDTSDQSFTVKGLKTTDTVVVNKPTYQQGLILIPRVSANNTLSITFMNVSGGAIVPTSETYRVAVIRSEKE